MSTTAQKIVEASPVVSVPAWLISLATDVQPVVNVVVGLLTAATLVFALCLRWREWKQKK